MTQVLDRPPQLAREPEDPGTGIQSDDRVLVRPPLTDDDETRVHRATVPDGVASVIVQVRAYEGQRAITAHAEVVNSVFATSIPETFGDRRLPTIVWLSAGGKIIRSVPGRVDDVATSGWCGDCR